MSDTRILGLAGGVHTHLSAGVRSHVARAGLTLEQYLALVGRGCPACGIAFEHVEGSNRTANIDHDHRLGELSPVSFRGLLCHRCNLLEGYFAKMTEDEATDLLGRLLAYRDGSVDK